MKYRNVTVTQGWPVKTILIAVWALGLATQTLFSWDLGSHSLTVAILLFVVPCAAWLAFGGCLPRATWASRVALCAVVVLYAVASLWLPLGAYSYVWRHEAHLLVQAERSLRGEAVTSSLGFEVRIEQEAGRVYWPRSESALRSFGLVYDPARRIGAAQPNSSLFGEAVVAVQHLRGPWYLLWLT